MEVLAEHVGRPLPFRAKLRLAGETLREYRRIRGLMHHRDVRETLAHVRREGAARDAPTPPEAQHDGARIGRVVARTLNPLPMDATCLKRSLVVTSLLARRGIPATVVIAVRPGETFAAHAWVEVDGLPVLDTGGGQYARLAEL